MNKARRMLAAGIGVVTPAFMVSDGVHASAVGTAAVEPVKGDAAAAAIDQDALKTALLELSPTDKLRAAGDRIRIARGTLKPQRSGGAHPSVTNCSSNCQIPGSGMLFAWK
jgi:hypothetical protein